MMISFAKIVNLYHNRGLNPVKILSGLAV